MQGGPWSEGFVFGSLGPQFHLDLGPTSTGLCWGVKPSLTHVFLPRNPSSQGEDTGLVPVSVRCCPSVQKEGSPGEEFPKAHQPVLSQAHHAGRNLADCACVEGLVLGIGYGSPVPGPWSDLAQC